MDALRRFIEERFDLSRPMWIDFFVAVPDEASGLTVARRAEQHGFRTDVERNTEMEGWTCYCTAKLILTATGSPGGSKPGMVGNVPKAKRGKRQRPEGGPRP